MMAYHLSIGRIMRRDWPTLGLMLITGLWWVTMIVIFLLAPNSHPEDDGMLRTIFAIASLLITVVCGGIALWRIMRIRRAFADGLVVEGRIVFIGENVENIGYAVVEYRYEGQLYHIRNVTEGMRGRNEFAEGQTVELVVDRAKPSRAFILRLYADNG